MSGRVQAGLAVALAVGLHVAGFAIRPPEAGAVSSGEGGADLVSLQAADAVLADLVTEWDRPPMPEVAPPAELTPPQMPDAPPPVAPSALPALPTPPMPQAMTLPQMAEAAPTADVSLPPPPSPEPEPLPKPEPLPEPKPEPPPPPPEREPEPDPEPLPPPPDTRPQPRPADLAKPAPKSDPPPKRVAKPAPPQPSAGQQAQRAAGSGGGAQAGDSGTARAATLSKARVNDLKAGWGASIRSRVERRKSYPSAARGASGTVTVRLTVTRAGQLAGVAVAASSGHPALDQAALRAVQGARFPAAPDGLTEASTSFTLPMTFTR